MMQLLPLLLLIEVCNGSIDLILDVSVTSEFAPDVLEVARWLSVSPALGVRRYPAQGNAAGRQVYHLIGNKMKDIVNSQLRALLAVLYDL